MYKLILIIGLHLVFGVSVLTGQTGEPKSFFEDPTEVPDTTKDDRINVDFAQVFELQTDRDTTLQKLIGEVALSQDSVFMYCDSATVINGSYVIAQGEVLIQQSDSVNIFSDSLYYDGVLKFADLYGDEVVFLSGNQELFTKQLHYDLESRTATYDSSAILKTDSTYLISRRGKFETRNRQAVFYDNVQVVSEDFSLRADSLRYDTELDKLIFIGPTLIQQDSSIIYCESGFYNIKEKKAEFRQQAQFIEGQRRGWGDIIKYDGEREEFSISGKANVLEPESVARAETILFKEKEGTAFLSGNAYYKNKDQEIAADEVVYNEKKKTYSTKGKTNVMDGSQRLKADQLDFDDATGLGIARGNVFWQDTVEQLIIEADFLEYIKADDFVKATGGKRGRPVMKSLVDGDTLYISADTLIANRSVGGAAKIAATDTIPTLDSLTISQEAPRTPLLTAANPAPDSLETTVSLADSLTNTPFFTQSLAELLPPLDTLSRDTLLVSGDTLPEGRQLLAYHDVRIFKSDLQGRCDSLAYIEVDSIFTLFDQPIIWSDSSQFTGDTIRMFLANKQLETIEVANQALIVSQSEEILFDQIKGRLIRAIFKADTLDRMSVRGNAQTIYYPKDENEAYIGVNQVACSQMMLYFRDDAIERIHFYAQPQGSITPMGQVDHQAIRLEGFTWQIDRRLRSMEDLFTPKKEVSRERPPKEAVTEPLPEGEEDPMNPKQTAE